MFKKKKFKKTEERLKREEKETKEKYEQKGANKMRKEPSN